MGTSFRDRAGHALFGNCLFRKQVCPGFSMCVAVIEEDSIYQFIGSAVLVATAAIIPKLVTDSELQENEGPPTPTYRKGAVKARQAVQERARAVSREGPTLVALRFQLHSSIPQTLASRPVGNHQLQPKTPEKSWQASRAIVAQGIGSGSERYIEQT